MVKTNGIFAGNQSLSVQRQLRREARRAVPFPIVNWETSGKAAGADGPARDHGTNNNDYMLSDRKQPEGQRLLLFLHLGGSICARRRRDRHRHAAIAEIYEAAEHEGKDDCAHQGAEDAAAEADRVADQNNDEDYAACNKNGLKPRVLCR